MLPEKRVIAHTKRSETKIRIESAEIDCAGKR
jgi:hypothetical protein